jgi:hypothetical protein
MTIEPPRGIKNNLLKIYMHPEYMQPHPNSYYRKLLFGLSLFHAVI